jgi:cell shape-determining protein MreD
MKRARLLAAATAALTALLLQATLVGPLTEPVPASLPAVLVGAVALVDGPGPGLAYGFVLGLLADLGSVHPAGVLALCWMGVGLACGTVARWHTVLRGAAVTGLACGAAALVAGTGLVLLGSSGATLLGALAGAGPAALVDGVLALALVPLVRRFLRTESLRAPHPVFTELAVSAHD